MNANRLLLLLLFICQFVFSQTEKLLKGVVSSENFLLYNVDVINKTSQKSTTTNEKGEFVISVRANDSLLFYVKDFSLKRLKVSLEQIEQNNLQVVMLKNAEELEEVVITKIEGTKIEGTKFNKKVFDAWEKGKREEIKVKKADDLANSRTVYDGTIDNGMDIFAVGKKFLGSFIKDKEPVKESSFEIDFTTLAINTCDLKFFTENLKLKPEEIRLFLQFCGSDAKTKKIIEHSNVLSMIDFLVIKNIEFQKLKEGNK